MRIDEARYSETSQSIELNFALVGDVRRYLRDGPCGHANVSAAVLAAESNVANNEIHHTCMIARFSRCQSTQSWCGKVPEPELRPAGPYDEQVAQQLRSANTGVRCVHLVRPFSNPEFARLLRYCRILRGERSGQAAQRDLLPCRSPVKAVSVKS